MAVNGRDLERSSEDPRLSRTPLAHHRHGQHAAEPVTRSGGRRAVGVVAVEQRNDVPRHGSSGLRGRRGHRPRSPAPAAPSPEGIRAVPSCRSWSSRAACRRRSAQTRLPSARHSSHGALGEGVEPGCTSVGEPLITFSTSAVAVCVSSAFWVSLISRAFSIAITAWSAKVRSRSIWCSAILPGSGGSPISRRSVTPLEQRGPDEGGAVSVRR